MTDRLSVMLVDDQVLFVESLKNVLEMRTTDVSVIAIAHNGQEALEKLKEVKPQIVLLDVRMPVMDGVETCKRINALYPEMKIMMLTTFDDDDYVHEAIKHGAVGYLLKNIPPEELISGIKAIQSGIIQISPSIARRLLTKTESKERSPLLKRDEPPRPADPDILEELSQREKDIMGLIREGLNNKDAAEELNLAEQTIKNHLSIIYSKLHVSNRTQAINKWRQIAQSD